MLSVQKYIELSPFPLTEGDIKSLGLNDEEYIPHTWQEIKDVIGSPSLSLLLLSSNILYRVSSH